MNMHSHSSKSHIIPGLAFLLALLIVQLPAAFAVDVDTILDSNGDPVFILNYFNTNEYSPSDNMDLNQLPAWYVTEPVIRQSIHNAGKAWANIIGSVKMPATLSVVGEIRANASAASNTVVLPDGSYDYSSVGAALNLGYDARNRESPLFRDNQHGQITVGKWLDFGGTSFYSNIPATALPRNGDTLPTEIVFFHEFGHALGIIASRKNELTQLPNGSYYFIHRFDDGINLFTQGLINSQGVRAKAGKIIVQNLSDADYLISTGEINSREEAFIADDGEIFFTGEHLSDVLQGAYNNRAPINGWENGDPEFSHIEFKNSLMSHQGYRNTGVFFEAELAILQDIGYTIDRKNFYGFSVYNDNATIVNNQGFFARNEAGTAYLENVHNQATNAIGLHLFGNNISLTQNADILAAGYGALGSRIDGMGNHLTINKDVRVESLGEQGIGVAVTYGKNHTLNHQGAIIATGVNGRGVSFDFGSNIMSDVTDYQGSHISTDKLVPPWELGTNWKNRPLEEQVDGALVNRFDMSGTIISDYQAIFISEDAHVREINILEGAFLKGDIVSEWNPNTVAGNKHSLQLPGTADYADFITHLTFGRAKDADGNVVAGAFDPNFRLRYSDDIQGAGGLALNVVGGIFEYNGNAHVVSVHNEKTATLAGTGTLRIANPAENISSTFDFAGRTTYANDFINDGILSPGVADNTQLGRMNIILDPTANFINNGTILLSFDQHGGHDVLEISGDSSNSVFLDGITEMRAMAGYYASGITHDFDSDNLIQTDQDIAVTDQNAFKVASFSPTVDFNAEQTANGVRVYASRDNDSYAQFANDAATQTVGREVSRISYLTNMPSAFRDVLTGLDLAGSVGRTHVEIGLNQLVPHFMNAAAQQSLDNQRVMSSALLSRLLPSVASSSIASTEALGSINQSNEDGRRVFATAIGGGGKQDNKGYDIPGYSFWSAGVLTGIELQHGGLMGGAHIAMNHWTQRGEGGSEDKNKVDAFSFGLHGSAAPADWNGGYLFGLARGTVERNRMNRAVNLITDRSVNTSRWTGWSGNAVLGGGFDFDCGLFRIGPMAGLDYAATHRGSVNESGRFGVLDIESESYQSFRTLAGLRAGGKIGEQTTLSSTARWNYEMLDKTGTTRARFSQVGLSSFSTRGRYAGRHSLTASIGLKHAVTDRVCLEIEGGGEFFRGGHTSGWGSASIALEFF